MMNKTRTWSTFLTKKNYHLDALSSSRSSSPTSAVERRDMIKIYFKEKSFHAVSTSKYYHYRVTTGVFVTENPVYSTFCQTASEPSYCNFHLASALNLFSGERRWFSTRDPVTWPFPPCYTDKYSLSSFQNLQYEKAFKTTKGWYKC